MEITLYGSFLSWSCSLGAGGKRRRRCLIDDTHFLTKDRDRLSRVVTPGISSLQSSSAVSYSRYTHTLELFADTLCGSFQSQYSVKQRFIPLLTHKVYRVGRLLKYSLQPSRKIVEKCQTFFFNTLIADL